MEKFKIVSAQAAVLLRPNINTDVIIRINRAALPRSELGRYAFEAWRFRSDGGEEPEFVLNMPVYRGAKILLAGPNFGCGSSREHAVWALQGAGIRCVIAPSFGDIFFGNCFQNGVLPVILPAESVMELAAAVESTAPCMTTVDLEQQVVIAPNAARYHFHVEPLRRTQLLDGLDEIALTLRDGATVDRFQSADRLRRPWIY
ncbi:MAG TPA: 3-isopropylmalate dehydratase small subunit [Burkholderiaceae bacterium]|nr:3-isopropylmalate dehydratase small subunit [Burkholderiaceae bacterium]